MTSLLPIHHILLDRYWYLIIHNHCGHTTSVRRISFVSIVSYSSFRLYADGFISYHLMFISYIIWVSNWRPMIWHFGISLLLLRDIWILTHSLSILSLLCHPIHLTWIMSPISDSPYHHQSLLAYYLFGLDSNRRSIYRNKIVKVLLESNLYSALVTTWRF